VETVTVKGNVMILAILQARVSSTRLPGKVLKPILGKPMLLRQIERIRLASMIDTLIVATSTDPTDDAIERLCRENNITFYRGSLDDVLDRFYQASKPIRPDHVVRLTGDCPLTAPRLIDEVITFHVQGGYDYSSNTIEPTWPDGLDIEVIRFSCLEQAWNEATLPSHREHVTPFIHGQANRFRIGSFKGQIDMSAHRWTVDEPEDFELVTNIYEALYPNKPDFTTTDILGFLEKNPGVRSLNAHLIRNEGYQKSLIEDRVFVHKTEQ
jgi:spore coat polysaccharide biosynthesis protein SpsF